MKKSGYYEHLLGVLLDLTEQRKALEKCFERDKRDEYDRVCNRQLQTVGELLDLGIDREDRDGIIRIFVNERTVLDFTKREIISAIGAERFNGMFPPKITGEEVTEDTMENYTFDQSQNGSPYSGSGSQSGFPGMGMPQMGYSMFGMPNMSMIPVIVAQTMQTMQSMGYLGLPNGHVSGNEEAMRAAREAAIRERDRANEELVALRQKLKEIELQRLEVEKDKTASADALKKIQDEMTAAAAENEQAKKKIAEQEQLISDLDAKLESAKAQLNVQSETEARQDELMTANEHLQQLVEDADRREQERDSEFTQLQATCKELEDAKAAAEQAVAKLESEQREAEAKLKAANDAIGSVNERNREFEAENKTLQELISGLREQIAEKEKNENSQIAELNSRIAELTAQIAELKNSAEDRERSIQVLSETMETEKQASMRSAKFDVFTDKALISRFDNQRDNIFSIADVDIYGMSKINMEYGENVGDKIIRAVIDELSKNFGKDNLFMHRGARFYICCDLRANDVSDTLRILRQRLLDKWDIRITYGVAKANTPGIELDEVLAKAESAMKQMRGDKCVRNSDTVSPLFQSDDEPYVHKVVPAEPAAEAPAPAPKPAETLANPNMSRRSLYYPDDDWMEGEAIIEADKTQEDQAAKWAAKLGQNNDE